MRRARLVAGVLNPRVTSSQTELAAIQSKPCFTTPFAPRSVSRVRLREGQLWAYRCCKYRGVRTVVHTRQMYREFLYHRHFKLFYLIELFKGGTPSWYVPRDVGTSSERTGRKVVALGMVQFLWRRPRFVQKEKKKCLYTLLLFVLSKKPTFRINDAFPVRIPVPLPWRGWAVPAGTSLLMQKRLVEKTAASR